MASLNTRNIEPENRNPLNGTVLHAGDIISHVNEDWEAVASPDDSVLSSLIGAVTPDDRKLSVDERREKELRDKYY